jgi:pyruvyl transferase EpsO
VAVTEAAGSNRRVAAITGLQGLVRDAIAGVVPRGTRVALLDFPAYGNVGDSAIWLGQLAALRHAGARVAYAASAAGYDAAELRRNLHPDHGVVLLSGGGNLGDLWPVHGELRRKVLTELRDYRVVQLPQSIHFGDDRNRDGLRSLLRGHPSFTLFVRDQPSRAVAESGLEHPVVLCPDMVFALGPLSRPSAPERPVVWLSRNDQEGPGAGADRPDDPPREDWVDEPAGSGSLIERAASRWKRLGGGISAGMDARLLRARAELRLRWGARLLARGHVVVTNRLHGMILAMLLGIPHFVSDTKQGKIGAFHRTWLADAMPGVLCDSEAEALNRARALAATLGAGKANATR